MKDIKGNKASKKEAGYIKQSKTNEKCINCSMWRDPYRCSAVKGIISPEGWCEWFEAGSYGKHGKKIDEHGGRVVKGVNTTQDVGVDEIKKQAAKFGNKVNKDGYPPLLNKKANKNTHPNTLHNLGLSEKYTPLQIAIIEGGHSLEDQWLEEDWKTKLKNTAAAGSLGLAGLTGVHAADDYNEYMSSKGAEIQQQSDKKTSELAPKRSMRPVSSSSSSKDYSEKSTKISSDSDEAPEKSKRPVKRSLPDIAITSRKSEQYLIKEAVDAGITGIELAAFLAQAALETNGFKYLTELGDDDYFQSYDPVYNPAKAKQLGNTKVGDGSRYKGRGYIQLTGRYNYTKVGQDLGIDLEKNPKLVEKPKIAAQTAILYWKNRVRPYVSDFTDVGEVTKFINPRKKHLDKRKKYFDLYVETMTRSGKINENDEIVDLSGKRKEKELQNFHKGFQSNIRDTSEQKKQAYEIAYNEGLFDDLPIGSRFSLSNGSSYKILSHTMTRHKTDELPRHQKEFRKKHNFGPAKFIEYEGYYYRPMIYAEEVAGEMDGSKSAFELDKLINFDTGEKRYTKFTGPKKVSEKKSKQVKGKEKKPKKVKPSTTGQQPHPYRGRLVGEDTERWYHGTPDVRNIRKQGGFEERTTTVSYISDPEKWKELQKEMVRKRETDMKEYSKLIDEVSKLKKTITIPSPIFLTNKYDVAKTYADPKRAFDYQGAEETILTVTVDTGRILTVDAAGSDFRGIDLDKVMNALAKSGISPEKSKKLLMMFNPRIRNDKLSTDALAVIGHMFNFDTIDVLNVLDSYQIGKTKSVVRMVFNPSRIKVINKLNEKVGYKVMRYDPTTNMVYSIADDNNKFPLKVGDKISMRGKGIYLSNNEDFVKNYYSGLTDTDEVLLKIEYDPKSILVGNDKDSESEFTVPYGKIKGIEFLSEKISKDFIKTLKENMSYTATYKKQEERDKNIEPGTKEWFEHWFSLPFMIDQRKKKRKNDFNPKE